MTQSIGSTAYTATVPTLSDNASILEAFKYYHQGGLSGSPTANSIEQYLVDLNNRAQYIENAIGYVAYNPINPATTLNSRVTTLESTVGTSLSSTYVKMIPSSNTGTANRNIITPSTTAIVPLTIQGIVGQTGNLQEWQTSAATVAKVDSTGKLFGYSTTDSALAQVVTISDTQTLTNKTLTYPVSNVGTNARTASYTLALSDQSKIVEMGVSSSNTLTVPTNASVAFPIGTQIAILQTGTGQTTITPFDGTVTINTGTGLKLIGQWRAAILVKRDTNTWVAFGGLTA